MLVCTLTTHIFDSRRVLDGFVCGDVIANPMIKAAFVRVEARFMRYVSVDNILHRRLSGDGNVEGTHVPAALD